MGMGGWEGGLGHTGEGEKRKKARRKREERWSCLVEKCVRHVNT